MIDLTGETYGELQVLGEIDGSGYSCPRRFWICLCSCGKLHPVYQGDLRSGAVIDCAKCSRKRSDKGRTKGKYKICEYCGESYYVKASQEHTSKFCSVLCHSSSGRETRVCKYCNESFETKKSSDQKYCSHLCFSRDNSGSNCHLWNKELSDVERDEHRDSPENREWSLKVKERDDFKCQNCQTRGGDLESHHILAYSRHQEARIDIDNGATLCKRCHVEFHHIYSYLYFTAEEYWRWLRNG